ncbi:MAG: hypothetical protein H5T97_03245 [Firmicutes bacterium]|nr:hypothetical protein [Bacillota bacterium]
MRLDRLMRLAVLAGLGALSWGREKGEELVRELAAKGEMTADEARSFLRELARRGAEERRALRNLVAEEVERLRRHLGLITREEWEALEERVRRLEERLSPPEA